MIHTAEYRIFHLDPETFSGYHSPSLSMLGNRLATLDPIQSLPQVYLRRQPVTFSITLWLTGLQENEGVLL